MEAASISNVLLESGLASHTLVVVVKREDVSDCRDLGLWRFFLNFIYLTCHYIFLK